MLKQLLSITSSTLDDHVELLASTAGLCGIGRSLPSLFAPAATTVATWALQVVLPGQGFQDDLATGGVPGGRARGGSWRVPSLGLVPKAAVLKVRGDCVGGGICGRGRYAEYNYVHIQTCVGIPAFSLTRQPSPSPPQ